MDGLEIGHMVRKAYGIKTPMNVWKRRFTERPRLFECMAALAFPPIEFPEFRIGDTIIIKRPARYTHAVGQ